MPRYLLAFGAEARIETTRERLRRSIFIEESPQGANGNLEKSIPEADPERAGRRSTPVHPRAPLLKPSRLPQQRELTLQQARFEFF